MAALLTLQTLALWTQSEVEDVVADPFAQDVIDKVSEMCLFIAGHPEWTMETAPVDVKNVALWVAKRTYENPRQVVAEGSIGPIGGDRVLDTAALAMELTDSERATLERHNPSASPDGAGSVFTVSATPGAETLMHRRGRRGETIYVSTGYATGDEALPIFDSSDPALNDG